MARSKTFDVINYDGGMNNYSDARDIENNELAELLNVISLKKGEIICGYGVSALNTSNYPVINSNITVPKLLSKSLVSYKSDFNSELEEANTKHLLYTDGNKLYRLEYNGAAWSWAEITNLNSTGILHPSIALFDGVIRYSDGSFTLDSSSPYLPTNSTKFFGAVSRKYFNATTNTISEITEEASVIKPTDGTIIFNKDIETSSNNPTQGFLGTEVSEISNKTLEDLTFGDSITRTISESSGTNHVFRDFQHEHSSIGLLTADVTNAKMINLHGEDQTEVDINGQDDILAQFTTTSVVGGSPVTVYQIGNQFNASNYNYFFIDVNPDIVNSIYANEAEFVSNPNRSIRINGNFFQHNGSAWASANWQYTDYNPTLHKVNDDGTIGAAVTVIEDEDQPDFLNLRFNDTSGTTRYRVGIRTNSGEIAEINNIEVFATLGTISNDPIDRKHLVMDVGIHSGGIGNAVDTHRLQFDDFFNLDYQSADNLIEVTIAIPEKIDILHSIDFIVSNIHTYSSSLPNTNIIHTLDSNWIAEHQNKGWIKVAFKLDEQVNIENTPILGTLSDFIIRTNFTFNLFVDTSGDGLRPVSIDSVKQTTDNRGTWNGYYKFYYSWIYDEVQESGYYEFANQGNGLYLEEKRLNLKNIIRELSAGGFGARGKRITGANLYWLEYDEEREENKFDDPFLLAKLDFEKGVTKLLSPEIKSWSLGTTATDHYTHIALQFIDPPSSSTFSINSGYDYNPLNTIEEIRFRSAVSLNRRMYYGNVDILWEKYSGETNYKRNLFGDRIYKSLPNKPDVVPYNNFLEVDVNDGDEITALATYADRLLVYKENVMYLINATKTLEYLEDTYKYMGVYGSRCVCNTNKGVAWVNLDGVYHYDGENVKNLIDKKLSSSLFRDYLKVSTDEKAYSIAYEPKEKHIIVYSDSGNGWIYSFVSESWSKSDEGLDDSANKRSNLELHDNSIVQASIDSSNNVSFHSHAINNDASGTLVFDIRTKDFSITDIGQRKNIKAIYITYKGTMSGTRKVSFEYFVDKQSVAIAVDPSDLTTSPSGYNTIKLTPNPKSSGRNVHTIQLRIKSSGDNGLAFRNFELHDISVIYKEKSIK